MSPPKVLLIEDDALLRECLAEMLGDAGWEVAEAADAVEALDRMRVDGAPDVLVTDLFLGRGMSGFALVAAARLRWPEMRAVLMSGADPARLTISPGDRFLAKPFTMADLTQALLELRPPSVTPGCREAPSA